MVIGSEKDLMTLQAQYQNAKNLYIYLHEEMVKHGFSANRINLPEIKHRNLIGSDFVLKSIYSCFEVDIKQRCRKKNFVEARHAAAYLLGIYTDLSLRSIAKLCGQNDHTSALNSKKKCVSFMYQDFKYRVKVESVENLILAKIKSE